MTTTMGTRYSVRYLQDLYDRGNKKPLEDLVRAWKGIKELPPSDLRSFFVVGGYHGEPFALRAAVDALSSTDIYAYWGGWCNHGNVLFPTWHRVYVLRLEQALQSVVPGVMMPFWDETSAESLAQGIPSILTQEKFYLDGALIDNPLRSFTLPANLTDDYWGDNTGGEKTMYFKPRGYETVRYPLSGLVGNTIDREATLAHNAAYPDPVKNVALLDANITAWLHGAGPNGEGPTPADPDPSGVGIYSMFEQCLDAPNYTVFSNTTSAGAWNLTMGSDLVVPVEQPHNDIHLSVGGFDAPGFETGQVAGANGDMGENNTAALDPIFFFHHCNIDRMFWLWQKRTGHTDALDVIADYPGTSSSDNQGPTPGIAPGTALDLTTALSPFVNPATKVPYTSNDVVDIEKQLGFTYGPGSLDEARPHPAARLARSTKKLTARGIDRALFQGSFVLSAFATVTDAAGVPTVHFLGHHSVLSRWSVIKCANCRTHLEVIAHFSLAGLTDEQIKNATFSMRVQHRGAALPKGFKVDFSVSG